MILVVDDDKFYTIQLTKLLTDLGYKVFSVTSADEALEVLREKNSEIKIAILDLMMSPGQKMSEIQTKGGFDTGLVLAALIREAFPEIQLICSSLKQVYEIDNGELFDFVLPKPLHSVNELESILKLIAGKSENKVKAIDTLKLAPSIFGMGVDLKELAKWLRQKST
jgi:CheY-like chemotaxis protein